ncbi:hypothetical protein [Streptomyces sp. ALB3]|uniref:hypothetical protein n=1 Tax=Streptomyces sp. ALB3 TaxID=3374278 RepID=UPI0037D9FCDF
MEQHSWVLEGTAEITVDRTAPTVREGDRLRFRLRGPSHSHRPGPRRTRYALMTVLP